MSVIWASLEALPVCVSYGFKRISHICGRAFLQITLGVAGLFREGFWRFLGRLLEVPGPLGDRFGDPGPLSGSILASGGCIWEHVLCIFDISAYCWYVLDIFVYVCMCTYLLHVLEDCLHIFVYFWYLSVFFVFLCICLLACSLVCLLARLFACLLASLLAYLCACFLASLFACLLAFMHIWFVFILVIYSPIRYTRERPWALRSLPIQVYIYIA